MLGTKGMKIKTGANIYGTCVQYLTPVVTWRWYSHYLIEDRIVNQGTTGPLNLELNILPHTKLQKGLFKVSGT